MKKKPALLKRSGKSSLAIRNFLNNLKENDLHYENKQITQCVFLGVLRLKPVPSVFSNNVPSVSSSVENNKHKKVRNNVNKEVNKNVSKKNEINKVLGGKVSKRNPQKIKAAVKKVPSKKPSIKIKLHSKKKMFEPQPSTSQDSPDVLPLDVSETVTSDTTIASTTLTLKPITTSTKFNPVQNLFNKLKQKKDESHTEVGPAKITLQRVKEDVNSTVVKYKVCKINANGQNNTASGNKKLKKTLIKKKSIGQVSFPTSTSPITISDNESTIKRDKEDIIFLEDSNSNSNCEEPLKEDVIIINEEQPKPKSKERTSPRIKSSLLSSKTLKYQVVDKQTESRELNDSPVIVVDNGENQDIIIIPDEPSQNEKLIDKNTNLTDIQGQNVSSKKSELIVVDKIRELRVSPRLRKMELLNRETRETAIQSPENEVIVVADEEELVVNNITETDLQKNVVNVPTNIEQRNKNEKAHSRSSKIVSQNENMPQIVAESCELDISFAEKPKRKRNTMKSPALLPPMLLHAPMLLRSELASKKPSYSMGEKLRKGKQKEDTTTLNSGMKFIKSINKSKKLLKDNSEAQSLRKEMSASCQENCIAENTRSDIVTTHRSDKADDIICLGDVSHDITTKQEKSVYVTSPNSKLRLAKNHINNPNNKALQHKISSPISIESENTTDCVEMIRIGNVEDELIILDNEGTFVDSNDKLQSKDTSCQKKYLRKASKVEGKCRKQEEVVVKEENFFPRLLRSDLLKPKNLETRNSNPSNIENVPTIKPTISTMNKSVDLTEDVLLNKQILPRTLRSNLNRNSPTSQKAPVDGTILVKDEIPNQDEKIAPKHISQQKTKNSIQKNKQLDLDEIVVVKETRSKKQKERECGRLLRSGLSQMKYKGKSSVKSEFEEVIVLIHEEPKPKRKSPVSSQSTIIEPSIPGSKYIDIIPEEPQKSGLDEGSPRFLRSDTTQKDSLENASIRTRKSRTVKIECSSPTNEDIDIGISQRNFEITANVKKNTSDRLLRSEVAAKELMENPNAISITSLPRVLRSDLLPQKNSQIVLKRQIVSPRTTGKKSSPQKNLHSLSHELNDRINLEEERNEKTGINRTNGIHDVTKKSGKKLLSGKKMQTQTSNPMVKKGPKNILKKRVDMLATSKKVVESKKKTRLFKTKTKSLLTALNAKPKTTMLLRSELADLKKGATYMNLTKNINTKPAKLKKKNKNITDQLLQKEHSVLESKKQVKNKKKPLRTSTQVSGRNKNGAEKSTELPSDTTARSESTVLIPIQMVKDEFFILPNDNISKPQSLNLDQIINNEESTNIAIPTETSVLSKEIKKGRSKSPKKNTNQPNQIPLTITPANFSSDPNSTQNRKTAPKRKSKELNSDNIQKDPGKIQTPPLINKSKIASASISKNADITIFDFDETEPEIPPLRINGTPRKAKSLPLVNKESTGLSFQHRNTTGKSRRQKVLPQQATKAQAKAKLPAAFDEKSTPRNSGDMPSQSEKVGLVKTISVSRRKSNKNQTDQEQSQNESEKTKKVRRKLLPDRNSTPTPNQKQSTPIENARKTSTSPLKQTKITDMFNRVILNNEKSSPKRVTPKENNNVGGYTDLTPPSLDRRKETSTEESLSVFQCMANNIPITSQKQNGNERDEIGLPAPKFDNKPSLNNEGGSELYDEDSDCESRIEWIPEEYAEYKFKYSAKKMMTYKPLHRCKICLSILPTYYKLTKHKEEHIKKENPYSCKQCDQEFSNVEDLSAHLRIHKGKHPYTCKKCDIGFWSKKALDAHSPIHVLRKVKQPNKRFRCDVCAKEFSKLCDMERHTRVHTGEKPCVCNICNKRFQQSHNLSKHLLTHLHVKPYHCEICNKQFGRNDVLNRHLLTHSVDKPIKCPLCPKGFIRQTQLNNHMKKNHPDLARIGPTLEADVVAVN